MRVAKYLNMNQRRNWLIISGYTDLHQGDNERSNNELYISAAKGVKLQ